MADSSERAPLLADNEREDDRREDEITANIPANKHFHRPIKILTICISIASLLGVLVLIASFVIIQLLPRHSPLTQNAVQKLGICVSDATILITSGINASQLNVGDS